jgi:hypothetical protein
MRETLGKRIRHLEHKRGSRSSLQRLPLPLRTRPDAQGSQHGDADLQAALAAAGIPRALELDQR